MKFDRSQLSQASSEAVGTDAIDDRLTRRVWGLRVEEIHAAFWASHGVACVVLGSGTPPQKGADLYLLLEPDQGAHFDLRQIAESLLWNQAHITRLRLIERESPRYSEQVVLGASGGVERVERRYAVDRSLSGQILLGTRAEDAVIWSSASSATAAFAEMRRHGRLRVDSAECLGARFDLSSEAGEQALLEILVSHWAHPDHVIRGIREIQAGVFGPDGLQVSADDRFVAPVWIGAGLPDDLRETRSDNGSASLRDSRASALYAPKGTLSIGPVALWDEKPMEPREVIPIEELFASDSKNRAEARADPAGLYAPFKRLFDILGSLFALVVSAPILLICCIAVVVDDGFPIFFGHKRQTKGGATFRCWKFRTMRRNAESLVAELRKQNLCDGPQVNILNDPRVTRVGKVLRKFQLDEFPQFWNVLIGDMSIVGPRPSPDNENQFCPAWREVRLSVRPGITGYWQVMRTREQGKDFQEWIQYDIEYVERISPLMDLSICVRTVQNLLKRK